MCVDGALSGFYLIRQMQPGDNLQNVWMMFDHIKCVQGWTMARNIYNPIFLKVMTITVCDMQFEDT
jgi:hypothetical protein